MFPFSVTHIKVAMFEFVVVDREVIDINGGYKCDFCAFEHVSFQNVNSGKKRSVIWTLFSLVYAMVKLAYLSDYSLC